MAIEPIRFRIITCASGDELRITLSQPIVSAELNSIRDGNYAVQFDSQNSREEVEMALTVRNQSIRSDGREPVSS